MGVSLQLLKGVAMKPTQFLGLNVVGCEMVFEKEIPRDTLSVSVMINPQVMFMTSGILVVMCGFDNLGLCWQARLFPRGVGAIETLTTNGTRNIMVKA